MSQPEISRRCLSCGASVRAGARFCPQCGALMMEGEPTTTTTPPSLLPLPLAESSMASESEREIVSDAPSRREVASAFETWREESPLAPAEVEGPEPPESGDGLAARTVFDEPLPREGAEVAGVAGADSGTTAGRAGSESKRRRAGAVVKENIMPRVERMRDEALVVLEETPDDAGLRFVVAAVVLFLLFLLILFLSTVLK